MGTAGDGRTARGACRTRIVGLVLAVAVATASGCGTDPADGQRPSAPPPSTSDTGAVDRATRLLDDLEIAPERGDGYDRDEFGSGWATRPGGCDTRDRVLVDEASGDARLTGDCRIEGGRWDSWFDGQTHTDPGDLDIDHLVPLAEAWDSGASDWDSDRREEFANDLDNPDALVAVTAGVNRAKGAADPAEWLPPERDAWCRYGAAWVIQKHTWELTADRAEHDRLEEILTGC